MSYLRGRKGRADTIAAVTPTWLVTPLTLSGSFGVDHRTAADRRAARRTAARRRARRLAVSHGEGLRRRRANGKPDHLVQVGGSITATDSLTGKALQAKTGTQWKFLSFADSGQRIAALLRDDAQMMIGASTDFVDQVKVGAVRVIATVADRKVSTFPELTSIKEQGLDVGPLPEEFRGFVGPPEMPAEALTYYQDMFHKLVKAPGWNDFVDENGSVTRLSGRR